VHVLCELLSERRRKTRGVRKRHRERRRVLRRVVQSGRPQGGHEEIIDRHDNLTVAHAIYRGRVAQYPGRLVMLMALQEWYIPPQISHTAYLFSPNAQQESNENPS
jgi:hypothetical protein